MVCVPVKDQIANELSVLKRENVSILPVLVVLS